MDTARELLRASATDADAVRRYLQSIEASEELDDLLDSIAPRAAKCKSKSKTFLVQDDWLPLVHLLLQCESTRLRAASRVIQLLRRGSPSELESMQLLTEVNLGYARALDELEEAPGRTQRAVRRRKLLDEISTVLDVVFSFLDEVVRHTRPGKVLPQLLGLVPYFLGMLGELGDDAQTRALLAKLLELPWSCQTIPSLLDVLVDDAGLMSSESWRRLQENVERLVTTSPEMTGETMNPLIRECVLVASVTGDHKWVGIARYLLRQLPVHLRQEAEFNLQMSFHQSPRIVSLVCESIRSSKFSEEGDVKDAAGLFNGLEYGGVELTLDWRDLFLLLHSLQASKPILHHRTSSSRIATDASVFTDIEQLAWRIVQSDVQAFTGSPSVFEAGAASKTLEKHLLDQVELLLNFGGKQIHAREWKALLLMDIAFFWIEQSNARPDDDKVSIQKSTVALLLLQAIFETTQETRAELLSCLFERSQKPAQRKLAGETLSQLFISQSGKLFPHLNAIQDWLGLQFQRSFDSAREFFLIASRLATVYKDLYNFLMVFLRKLLSTGNRLHQQFAVDMWCSWLDHRLPFNEQQEEEIVSALKNSVAACQDSHAWSLGRLGQVFQLHSENPTISLRRSSWEEFHRFLSQEVGKFIEPTTSDITGYGSEEDDESADEYDDQDSGLPRFRFSSLDVFYQKNASLDGAAAIGLVFQKLISCLIEFEKAATQSKVSSEGLPIEGLSDKESDVKQWLVDLVSNWKYFFHWICQDSDDLLTPAAHVKANEKIAWWKLVARVYIGCAACNIVIEMLMAQQSVEECNDRDADNLALAAFRGDDSGISVWALMEVEFSLHRMIQKLAAHYASEMESSLSKEYVKAASCGLHRVLQPAKLQILKAVKCSLQDTAAPRVLQSERPSEMSFNAVLFALDSFYNPVGDEDLHGGFHPGDGVLSDAGSMLELLLCVYLNVRDRITSVEGNVDDVGRIPMDNGVEERGSGSKLQFSLYADTISAKFPTSARHLVAQGKHAKDVVLLDGKGGEEMLEHVCAAIGRTLDMMIKSAGLCSVHDRLGHVLQTISWTRHPLPDVERSSDMNNFVRLSRCFLNDVKVCVQLDGLTKLGVSCASLSKRLRDMATEMTDSSIPCSHWHALSSLAYDVLCDNVVYNPRLLRLLTSICLPIHLARQTTTFVAMESKIEGIIQSCGLNSTPDATTATSMEEGSRPTLKTAKRNDDTPNHRKRLRKGFDARSSNGLRLDSDSDSDGSNSSDSDGISRSDDSSTKSNSISVGDISSQPSSITRDRIPHLQSHASQSIAILAVLSVLEQSQSTLLGAMTAKNGDGEPCTFPRHQEILGYIRIHDLVNKAICNDREFSWGTRKVLLKVLHMIELSLRIGKSSGALRKETDDAEVGFTRDSAVCIFESSVNSALRSRTWVDGVKDASQDSGTKAKVSATLLKMDVFFLQVPGTVQTWLKEATLCEATTERLKTLVGLVKERIAPSDHGNVRRGKTKARQRLLGVVPIVRKRRKRLRSRHPIIDAFLNEEDGADAFADLEDFIE